MARLTVRDADDVRYGAALGLLLIAYVLAASSSRVVDLLVLLTFVGVLAIIVFDPQTSLRLRIAGLVIAVPTIVVGLVSSIGDEGDTVQGLGHFGAAGVLLVTIAALLARLLRHDEITLSTVMGAVMAYSLIAFMASGVYRGIDLLTDAPFFAQSDVDPSDFVYFSFVSLTTLGFGDLTPGTDLAKRLVVLETFLGQVFLVVLVARLVSLWGRPRRTSSGAAPP